MPFSHHGPMPVSSRVAAQAGALLPTSKTARLTYYRIGMFCLSPLIPSASFAGSNCSGGGRLPAQSGDHHIVPSVTPIARKLARRLLSFEAPVDNTGNPAAFCVTEKLRQPLSTLTGAAGFRALLSRALALAGEEVRWLKAIHVDASGSLEGLDETGAQLSPDEIAEGETILIARVIGLLMTFIGGALTAHLLQDIWPEVSPRDLDSETEKDNG